MKTMYWIVFIIAGLLFYVFPYLKKYNEVIFTIPSISLTVGGILIGVGLIGLILRRNEY
jgi:hypothetical protein